MQQYPSQISPAENFDIFYFLRNWTDSTTYYVQAVVYDVRTGDILQTTNLTQSPHNSHLYAKTIQAPADSSGFGRNIVAIATVYTDSDHTIKSSDYEEQEQYFLVRALPPQVGGGGDVDYRHIGELIERGIKKAIAKLPPAKTQTDIKFPDMPFDSLFGSIGALTREVGRIPKANTDLSPLQDAIAGVHQAVQGLPEPTEPIDLSPVLAGLQQLSDAVAVIQERDQRDLSAIGSLITTTLTKVGKQLEKSVTKAIGEQEITIPLSGANKQRSQEPEMQPAMDLSHLM
jgi:hypothetical protein